MRDVFKRPLTFVEILAINYKGTLGNKIFGASYTGILVARNNMIKAGYLNKNGDITENGKKELARSKEVYIGVINGENA